MKPLPALVLVLWGHYSDELVAATSIVKLRQAGVRVKLVGLERRKLRGANGLALLPDLTLGDALPLVQQVRAVIFTMTLAVLLHYLDDPRLVTLLQIACDQGAALILAQAEEEAVVAQLAQFLQRDVASCLQTEFDIPM